AERGGGPALREHPDRFLLGADRLGQGRADVEAAVERLVGKGGGVVGAEHRWSGVFLESGFLRAEAPAGSVARVVNARAGARRIEDSALLDRIAELEDRLRTLERRLGQRPARRRASRGAQAASPASAADRCPGCLLELPPGPRGGECVWCGFVFAAVRGRRAKSVRRRRGGGMQGPSREPTSQD